MLNESKILRIIIDIIIANFIWIILGWTLKLNSHSHLSIQDELTVFAETFAEVLTLTCTKAQ